jgi:hypothetical protein
MRFTKIWHNYGMRTTIELPDQLLTRAKSQAALKGISLKTFFIEAIEGKLADPPKRTRSFVPIIGGEGPPIRRATREEIDEAMFG